MRLIRRLIPVFFKDFLKNKIKKSFDETNLEKPIEVELKFHCSVCENKVSHFNRLPDAYLKAYDEYGFIHSIFYFETLNFLAYSCPKCYASDRNRLISLFLRKKLVGLMPYTESFSFLDVAPDVSLTKFVKKFDWISYRSVDLYMNSVDDNADICDLHIYESDKFDMLMCSHVLEHVEDDQKAISEFYRILKKGGIGILMVPILLTLEEDFENSDYTSEADRWKYYGLGDHLRIHSKKGFVKKLENVGFKVSQLGIDYFGAETFQNEGLHRNSVLYVVEK